MSKSNVPFPGDSANNSDTQARADQVKDNASMSQDFPSEMSQWETVPLPGMFSRNSLAEKGIAQSLHASEEHQKISEAQLLALVQDLNRCNEVLLSRVNQLEEALETSQQSLQQEVERSQQATEKTVVAQQHSVAQLLSELEQSNEALKRHTILAETLQAQLETSQERSKHLDREYALLQKRHANKVQQLLQAEESCRDLRARLQRQQRYTLQFKAALEKCLDTSAFKQSSVGLQEMAGKVSHGGNQESIVLNPSAMPKAESIQPWSTIEQSPESDPQLRSLMRSLQAPDKAEATPLSSVSQPQSSAAGPVEMSPDQDAEKLLWQDVERVIENSASFSQFAPEGKPEIVEAAPGKTVEFTEPLPWGSPCSEGSKPAAGPEEIAPTRPELLDLPLTVADDTASPSATSPAEAGFMSIQELPITDDTERQTPQTASAVSPSNVTVPALEAMQASQTSPSPIVHPLRPRQRKRTSLSAVELPSFPPLPKQDKTK